MQQQVNVTAPIIYSAEELERIAWAVQWAGHFATLLGDCKPGGPAASNIRDATELLERHGARVYHSLATRALIARPSEAAA